LPPKIRFAPALFLALAFLTVWRIPVSQAYVAETTKSGPGAVDWRKNAPKQVLDVILEESQKNSNPIAWCGFHGWLDGNTLSWEAIQHGFEMAMPQLL
jgi:hypothetical protein